jgi:hypothetical protein
MRDYTVVVFIFVAFNVLIRLDPNVFVNKSSSSGVNNTGWGAVYIDMGGIGKEDSITVDRKTHKIVPS